MSVFHGVRLSLSHLIIFIKMIDLEEKKGISVDAIGEFFEDENLSILLNGYMPDLSSFGQNLQMEIFEQSKRLYVRIRQKIQSDPKQSKKMEDIDLSFTLRITKRFPQQGSISLFLFQDHFHPSFSDTRDLMSAILGQEWNLSKPLASILASIQLLPQKFINHQNYQDSQLMGTFKQNDQFTEKELNEFKGLSIFESKEEESKQNVMVGISQTHFLVFTQQKKDIESQLFQRVVVAPLENIAKMNVSYERGIVEIKLSKSLSPFSEKKGKLWMYFVLSDVEEFKNELFQKLSIGKMMSITIDLGGDWKEEQAIVDQVEACNKMEEKILKEKSLEMTKQKRAKYEKLQSLYHQLILGMGNIGSAYYVLYVSKLQRLYLLLHPESQSCQSTSKT